MISPHSLWSTLYGSLKQTNGIVSKQENLPLPAFYMMLNLNVNWYQAGRKLKLRFFKNDSSAQTSTYLDIVTQPCLLAGLCELMCIPDGTLWVVRTGEEDYGIRDTVWQMWMRRTRIRMGRCSAFINFFLSLMSHNFLGETSDSLAMKCFEYLPA